MSGTGTQYGTAGTSSTPSSGWYNTQPTGFSDEAVWVINESTQGALEVGWYSGYGIGCGCFSSGLQYYYTVNNGLNEHDNVWNYMTPGSTYNFKANHSSAFHAKIYAARSDGAQVWQPTASDNYNLYGTGDSQGEVYQPGSMGPATWSAIQWSPDGTNWYNWGFNSDCANSPMHVQWLSNNSYKNWGGS